MRKSFYLRGLLASCFLLFSAAVRATPVDTLVIISNPVSVTTFPGFTAQFYCSAIDTPSNSAKTYDWQASIDGGTTWHDYAFIGPETDTFSSISVMVPIGSAGGTTLYRCVVSNDDGTDTSSSASLVVVASRVPVITSNPRDTTVCVTAPSVSFSVSAIDTPGSPALSYFWYESFDGGITWDSITNDLDTANISGMRSSTLTLLSPTGGILFWAGTEFMATVTSDSGVAASTGATLTIDLPNAGTITGPTAVCVGSTITLTSDIAGGTWSTFHHDIDTVDATGDIYGIAPGSDTALYTTHNTCGLVSTAAFFTVDTFLTSQPISGPTSTCVGRVIDLTNPNAGGVWSSTGVVAYVNSVGMVDGVSSGFEIIHYTITDACNSVDATYGVEVDTVINPGTISGPSTVCAGSWVSFTASLGGGIWLTSSSSVAIIDGDGNVTGVTDGVAIISYFYSNACGVSAATDTLVVSAPASRIGGLDSVGVGLTRLLTDSSAGGIWVSADTTIAKVDSATGVVTGVAAGVTTITYNVTNFCGTSSAVIGMSVGVATGVAITGPDSVCEGQTILLADVNTGGVWSTLTDTIAAVNDTGLVTGVAVGIAHITYTFINGFGPSSVTKTVHVVSNHVDSLAVPNLFSEGGSYTFYGFPTGGTWHSSNTGVGNFIGTPGFFVIYGHGTTTITYTVTTLCGVADTSFVVDIPNINGVNEVAGSVSVLNVYPNPSTGDFTVNLSSSLTEQAVVTVTNMVGEKVKEFTITTNKSAELSLDQPDGVYFISTETSTGKYSAKITITR